MDGQGGPYGCRLCLRQGGRTAEALALTASARQPGTDPFLDHRALELGKHAQYLEHGSAGGRAGVEALLVQKQVDAERVQLAGKADHRCKKCPVSLRSRERKSAGFFHTAPREPQLSAVFFRSGLDQQRCSLLNSKGNRTGCCDDEF
jgi:hypothetical protein